MTYEITKEERELFAKIGKEGGKITKERYGTDHFKRMAKLSAEKRRKNKQGAVDKVDLTN